MRSASAQLIALLHGNNTYLMADLFSFELATGEGLNWTSADTDITLNRGGVGSGTWKCSGEGAGDAPILERGGTKLKTGLEVDTLDITIKTNGNQEILGLPIPAAAANGAFDGAQVRLYRAFMPTWGDTSPDAVRLFGGVVAGVDPSRYEVAITVKSDLDKLNIPMPPTVFLPACANHVYDANCGLVRAAWTVNGTVGAGSTNTLIQSALTEPDKHFDLGVLAITSGPAAGARRAVRAYVNGNFTLSMPLPVAPNPGDDFTVYPGCYRTRQACIAKNNLPAFRGYPYVPVPEQAR